MAPPIGGAVIVHIRGLGNEVSLFEFLHYINAAGALGAPIFAILFWLERNERQSAQKELREIAENSTSAINEMKAMISQLTMIFTSSTRHK